jgi:hypothetical protein
MPKSELPKSGPAEDPPLRVDGFEGTPEEIERQWFEEVYRGRGDSMPQLTVRAVCDGHHPRQRPVPDQPLHRPEGRLGFGVTITACIVSYGLWSVLLRLGLAKTPMTILENNCMQSTSSAAGYSTGTTLVSAFAAYFMINNQALPLGLTLAWVFFLAVLGVTMAIP